MRRPRARGRERGVALLLVLWVFMVLGVLALDFARFMRDDAMASVNFAEESHGYYVALAGLNRALFDFQQVRENDAAVSPGGRVAPGASASEEPPIVPPDAQWHEGEFAGARWAVRMTDEGALRLWHLMGDANVKHEDFFEVHSNWPDDETWTDRAANAMLVGRLARM